MLEELVVRNFALVDSLTLSFDSGFTVQTAKFVVDLRKRQLLKVNVSLDCDAVCIKRRFNDD